MSNRNNQALKAKPLSEEPSVPTETTPLNQHHSSAQQTPINRAASSESATMDAATKSVLVKIAIDVTLLCCGE